MSDDPAVAAERLARQRDADLVAQGRAAGAETERVNGRLVQLEDHAKSVNGQIRRLAEGQDRMNEKLTKISVGMEQRALVTSERDSQKISKRSWLLGIGMFALGVGTVTATILQVILK